MSKIVYECATVAHAVHVAKHMRKPDEDEVWACSAIRPLVAMTISLRASSCAVTGLLDGEPIGIFGVVPVNTIDGVGAPWMLGTDKVDGLSREWLVDAGQWLTLIGDGYSVLRNWVDARNVKSKRWLKRMGFRVYQPAPHGISGLPFHLFERRV